MIAWLDVPALPVLSKMVVLPSLDHCPASGLLGPVQHVLCGAQTVRPLGIR
jgi:hypothetical protein